MSTRNLALRHTIRKATIKDCGLINRLAWKAFPPTYQAILTPEQIEGFRLAAGRLIDPINTYLLKAR